MSDITLKLKQIEAGEPGAAEQLLPLVYDELRQLAAARLAKEPAGQTLQATALVHEAYLRLVPTSGHADENAETGWNGRAHFFAAAAESMRRILVDNARRKNRLKHGGGQARQDINELEIAAPEIQEDLLALDGALDRLAATDAQAARLIQLRYFAGLSIPEAARALEISPRSADRLWAYAKAWLHQELHPGEASA
jgi:RNA polymerase sigma factor (TIGR02999 family)